MLLFAISEMVYTSWRAGSARACYRSAKKDGSATTSLRPLDRFAACNGSFSFLRFRVRSTSHELVENVVIPLRQGLKDNPRAFKEICSNTRPNNLLLSIKQNLSVVLVTGDDEG